METSTHKLRPSALGTGSHPLPHPYPRLLEEKICTGYCKAHATDAAQAIFSAIEINRYRPRAPPKAAREAGAGEMHARLSHLAAGSTNLTNKKCYNSQNKKSN
jgi:hypothetical protein